MIENIRDFDNVCDIISRTSQDQYADAMYPNDMRPDENHGYNTTSGHSSGLTAGMHVWILLRWIAMHIRY